MELLWASDFKFSALSPITGPLWLKPHPRKRENTDWWGDGRPCKAGTQCPKWEVGVRKALWRKRVLELWSPGVPWHDREWQVTTSSWLARICPHITLPSPWSWKRPHSWADPDVGSPGESRNSGIRRRPGVQTGLSHATAHVAFVHHLTFWVEV